MEAADRIEAQLKLIADEVAEMKAKQQAIIEVALHSMHLQLAGLPRLEGQPPVDADLFVKKYVQFLEHYREQYRRELAAKMADADNGLDVM